MLSAVLAWVIPGSYASPAESGFLPVLETGGGVYSNVTVMSKSASHVFIKHSRGFSTLKLNELNRQTLVELGCAPPEKPAPPPPPLQQQFSKLKLRFNLNNFNRNDWTARVRQSDGQVFVEIHGQSLALDANFVRGLLWSMGCAYALFCYCSMLICRKAGTKGALWCWIPVIQIFPLLRAAGMSAWFFLLLFLPVINLFVGIAWCVKICRVRAKGPLATLFLLLPGTSPLAFMYLALSSDGSDPDSGRVHLSYPASQPSEA